MSSALETLQIVLQDRQSSNTTLAACLPQVKDGDRQKIARPTNTFLSRCVAIVQTIAAQPTIAAHAGLDLAAMNESAAQIQAIDALLIQVEREARILRDARLVHAEKLWTTTLKARRLAKVLADDDEGARYLAKELNQFFTGGRKPVKKAS